MHSVKQGWIYCIVVYSRTKANQRRKRRMKKNVHPELFHVWSNFSDLVSPPTLPSPPSCSYPSVEWRSVNKRFLTNIPSPSTLPILGCSPSPEDYEDVYQPSDYGGMRNTGSKFTREFPFGSALGFITSAGPINVPDEVFHGYVYDVHQGWILHARFPEKRPAEKVKKKIQRRQRG